jgi:hypothetical protein
VRAGAEGRMTIDIVDVDEEDDDDEEEDETGEAESNGGE